MLWYYAVGDDSVFPDDLKFYAVEEHGGEFPRSVPVNTFGNLLESPELTVSHGVLRGSGKRFDIRIHSRDADAGVRALGRSSARRREAGIPGETGRRHCALVGGVLGPELGLGVGPHGPGRSRASRLARGGRACGPARGGGWSGALVAQSYNVFRFLMACQSRGRVQAKFNGGPLHPAVAC